MNERFKNISVVTCANCGYKKKYRMPRYAMQTIYNCPRCKTVHQTEAQECCIFCHYGTVACPNGQKKSKLIQLNRKPEDLDETA